MSSDLVPLPAGTLTPVALDLDGVEYEQWLDIGRRLNAVANGTMWWLGDWWRYGERRWGARKAAAEAVGIPFGTCANAGYVAGRFAETSRRREVSWGHHYEVAALDPDEADELIDLVVLNSWSVSTLRKEVNARRRRKMAALGAGIVDVLDGVEMRVGDFREVLGDLPPGSIDAIITDPPYPAEFLHLWKPLAEIAARLLAPHGALVMMAPQAHLPEIFASMDGWLPYRWTYAYLEPGPQGFAAHARTSINWKPLLVYGRGPGTATDVITSPVGESRDLHDWQQGYEGTRTIVERFTEPGWLVLDPFLGSGTAALACRDTGREFIGCDIDPANIDITRARLAEPSQGALL